MQTILQKYSRGKSELITCYLKQESDNIARNKNILLGFELSVSFTGENITYPVKISF